VAASAARGPASAKAAADAANVRRESFDKPSDADELLMRYCPDQARED
jgi:hypothetical protein